jgi:hypothetical protein
MVQSYAITIADPKGRPNFPLGASLEMFTRIYGGNVILGTVLGRTRLAIMSGSGALLFLACSVVVGLAILLVCFFKAEIEMKLFLIFTSMLLAISLVRSTTYPQARNTVWQMLAQASDIRDWVLPSLAFAWSLLWLARSGKPSLKPVIYLLFLIMCFSAGINWKHPALKDLSFVEYAEVFEAVPPGTVIVIPENPAGWQIELVKHP